MLSLLKHKGSWELPNGDLLRLTDEKNWVLITHDSDFLNQKFKPKRGIIIVRIHPAIDGVSGTILERFLSSVEHEILKGKITILEKKGWYFLKE